MTDTVPAAATGLPSPDRRALLGSAALATIVAATAALPAVAADHPDAELLELAGLLAAALVRQRAYDHRTDQAFEAVKMPDIPDALFWREADRPLACIDVDRCETVGEEDRPVCRSLDALTPWAQQYLVEGEAYDNSQFIAADRARAREIRAALNAWEADLRRAEDIAGVTTPNEAAEREDELIQALRLRVAETRARTFEGLIAKGSAAAGAWGDPEGFIKCLLEKTALEPTDWRDILSLSLIVDAVKFGAPASAAADNRSVA